MQLVIEYVEQLFTELEETADTREQEGALSTATAYRFVAKQLREKFAEFVQQPLTRRQAEALSGYSRAQLNKLLRDKTITLRVADLPIKPGTRPAASLTVLGLLAPAQKETGRTGSDRPSREPTRSIGHATRRPRRSQRTGGGRELASEILRHRGA